MSTNLKGKPVAQAIRENLRQRVQSASGRAPGLAVVLVGDDPASEIYVSQKSRQAGQVGIFSVQKRLPRDSNTESVVAVVDQLNQDPLIDGILVQLPLPPQVDQAAVIQRIRPDKDVDGLTLTNQGALMQQAAGLWPCTPLGIMDLLDAYHIAIEGRHAAVIGRSILVGRPLALMLLHRNATVTMLHSHTPDPAELTRQADILVVAAGKRHLVTAEWVKPGAVVIDVGIHRSDSGLSGDVDFDAVQKVAQAITPVPGGVGPMTIAELLKNTWQAYLGHEGLQ